MDRFGTEVRSRIMKAVRSTGNRTTEMKFALILRRNRIKGWRRKSQICGKPDFVFRKQKIAVFVDGCFWHGHTCRNLSPTTNIQFWRDKIENVRRRDRSVNRSLKKLGWTVCRIWECQLDEKRKIKRVIDGLKRTKP